MLSPSPQANSAILIEQELSSDDDPEVDRWPDRLEAACERALAVRAHSYRSVESILRTGLDRQALPPELPARTHPDHDNLRGPGYYQ